MNNNANDIQAINQQLKYKITEYPLIINLQNRLTKVVIMY